MRPIRHFLSHQHLDRDPVRLLETDMRRRGLASWRDRKDQPAGAETEAVIKRAIDHETDGFVFYGSPNILTSDFVWDTEWPPAYLRNRAETDDGHTLPYPIVPLTVRGTKTAEVSAVAKARKHPIPTRFNGERLDESDPASRRAVATFLLRSALARRIIETADPLRLHFATFEPDDDLEADVLVDWTPEFVPGADPCWLDLLAARDDLKRELARVRRGLVVSVQARLGAAFAFGHAFPRPAEIPIVTVEGWAVGDHEDTDLVTIEEVAIAGGDRTVAILEASFMRSVTVAVDRAIEIYGLRPSRRVSMSFGATATTVDAAVAAAATAAFAHRVRRLADDGIKELHVFYAGPAALALLLGSSINAGPTIVLYHAVDREYVETVRLHP